MTTTTLADVSPVKRGTARRPLVVFADDWGRHPSSCQHLVRQLLDDYNVHWINSIGTRMPRLNWGTLSRGYGKLREWILRENPRTKSQDGPRVLCPAMWPGFRTRWQRSLNQRLIARFLEKQVPQLGDAVLLTTVPIVADILDRITVKRSVYYCVDDFSAWPGLDSGPLREMEQKLAAKVDRIVAAGENLADRMRQLGRNDVSVLTHGLDLDHWWGDATPDPIVRDLPRPIVLFWGLIDQRLDAEWLAVLGRSMSSGTIALVGPEQHPDPALNSVPRLRRLGSVAYDRLPAVANGADLLIMPYVDSQATRAMQPLKLKEYLATRKPVVVRQLPAVVPWEDCLDAATTVDAFCSIVHQRLAGDISDAQIRARQRLSGETWREKARMFSDLLCGGLT